MLEVGACIHYGTHYVLIQPTLWEWGPTGAFIMTNHMISALDTKYSLAKFRMVHTGVQAMQKCGN